ncbi:TraR/DksA family transcriptional regulator [Aquipuribacter nitratireducens]|uniref:TraR/DksA family transcriptional regulator n=1 Tax=Aquipuribacter nitratireducens TaxID=650104 RepID=A0ABW0GP78_9MICO
MSDEDLLTARLTALAAQEQRLLAQLDRVVAASEQSNADDEHDPEGATIAWERQQLAAVLDQVRRSRAALEEAVAARARGEATTCERCGATIDPRRLEARPEARTCIDCARSVARRR